MAKRGRRGRSSPFLSLNRDCLDLISVQLLDNLVSEPLESLRSFTAFSTTTRWKPGPEPHTKIAKAFTTLEGRTPPPVNVPRLMQTLQTLKSTPHPLRELPTTVDEWRHAYLFFSQMKYAAATRHDTRYNCQKLARCGLDAINLCAAALDDADAATIQECKDALKSFVRVSSVEQLASHVVQHPFLLSRCGCTPIVHTRPWLWFDELGLRSPLLAEFLKHDPYFLRSCDALGVPTSHAIFTSGFQCMRTFEFVIKHPTFCIGNRTRAGNTVAHSLATCFIDPRRSLMLPHFHTLYDSKCHMAYRLCETHLANQNIFCSLNNNNVLPWQQCAQSISSMIDTLKDPECFGQARQNLFQVVDTMEEVTVLLRMACMS